MQYWKPCDNNRVPLATASARPKCKIRHSNGPSNYSVGGVGITHEVLHLKALQNGWHVSGTLVKSVVRNCLPFVGVSSVIDCATCLLGRVEVKKIDGVDRHPFLESDQVPRNSH